MRYIFRFFKLILQIVIGCYAASMFIAVPVASVDGETEVEDDFLFYGELEAEIGR